MNYSTIAQKYYPLVKESHLWNVTQEFVESTYTISYRVVGDTVMNEKHYKKFMGFYVDDGTYASFPTFIREDTIEKKIYTKPIYSINDSTEYLLYDFSLNVGDTFLTYYIDPWLTKPGGSFKVVAIDSINLTGTKRKMFTLVGHPFFHPSSSQTAYWIEGIGSTGNFLYSGDTPGGTGELTCFFDNGIQIYKSPKYSDCLYFWSGIEELQNKHTLNDYPNPFEDIITIDSENKNKVNIRCVNQVGQTVFSSDFVLLKNYKIDLSFLKEGIYYLQFIEEGNQKKQRIIETETIVKTNCR